MIYIIKYLYQTFLLPPGIFIVALLVFSLWLYKKQVKLSIGFLIITFIFYLSSIPFVGDLTIRSLENRYIPPSDVRGDVLIMLGGGATLDTPNVEGTGHLLGYSANRLLTCAQLYYKLNIPIIISGGQVFESTGTEAGIAKNILKGLNVPEDKIIIDNKSLNTTQNAIFTKELVDKYGFTRPILVTSAFHMDRAVRQFKKVNLAVTPFPTDYQANAHEKIQFHDFIPASEALQKVNLALKEYIGILAVRWY